MSCNYFSNRTLAQALVVTLFLSYSAISEASCKVNQLNGSTNKFVVLPYLNKVYSSFPGDGLQIRGCDSDVSHIILSKNTVFQHLNSRSQSVNKLSDLNVSNNCSIINTSQNQHFNSEDLKLYTETKVKNDHEILKQCVLLEVSSQSGRQINITENSECFIVSYDAVNRSALLKGERCVIDYKNNDLLSIKLKISEQCKSKNFYSSFEAKDVLSQLMVHSARITHTKNKTEVIEGNHSGPEFSRQVAFKFLPDSKAFVTSQDEVSKINYPSVLNVNFSQGGINIRSIGSKTRFDFEYLVQNVSKQYCDLGMCTRGSNSYNPVFAKINVYKIDQDKRDRLLNSTPFYAPVVVPSQWSGILELSDRSLFLGNRSSIYTIDQVLKEGDNIKIETEFYDAKYAIDNILSDSDTDIKFDFESESSQDLLPKLPALAAPVMQYKLLSLPTLNMDQSNIMKELNNFAFDLNSIMTHSYSKICNESNECAKISINKPFQKIVTKFTILNFEYGLAKTDNITSFNSSLVYGDKETNLNGFPSIECK